MKFLFVLSLLLLLNKPLLGVVLYILSSIFLMSNLLVFSGYFGLDTLSMIFLLLSILVFLFTNFLSYTKSILYPNFFILFFSMFFFLSLSLMYFFFSFELILIPIVIIILGWGYQYERLQASFYLMVYTIFCSLPMLYTFLVCTKVENSNLFMGFWSQYLNTFFSLFLLLGFLVKMPMFMFHLWLPKAHVEAPTLGSMQLAGVLLKLGTYGFLRMATVSFFYLTNKIYLTMILIFCLLSVLTYFQSDNKMLVAYNSIVHMNFLLLCFVLMNKSSFSMGGLMSLTHAITSASLFYLMGELYQFIKNRKMYFLQLSYLLFTVNFLNISSNTMANLSIPPMMSSMVELSLLSGIFSFQNVLIFSIIFLLMWNSISSLYLLVSSICSKQLLFMKEWGYSSMIILFFVFFSLNFFFVNLAL